VLFSSNKNAKQGKIGEIARVNQLNKSFLVQKIAFFARSSSEIIKKVKIST